MERGSGLLLHISSLPSSYGIGTFGLAARRFVDQLKLAGQKYWQILPLNPTTYGDSPYQSTSTFALNPYFIDLDILIKKQYLTKMEVKKVYPHCATNKVDYQYLFETRFALLHLAYTRMFKKEHIKIMRFLRHHKYWLDDYALFMSIKNEYKDKTWLDWPKDIKLHKKAALEQVREQQADYYYFVVTMQYMAFEQYAKLKKYAKRNGVHIIGDLPIYVALDSSDVWSHRKEFLFDKKYSPSLVAGVPPDYFSATGQLWGNPLYDYDKMAKNDFRWWRRRIRHMRALCDLLRIDHFRGFSAFYAVKYGSSTAVNGQWIEGPKKQLIDIMKEEMGDHPIIAEDLGIIDDDVRDLLKYGNFPGLKVFQFAFASQNPEDAFLPHTYDENCVAYLGTHDNDVMESFIIKNPKIADLICNYLECEKNDIIETSIKTLLNSKADIVIFQVQDIAHLNETSRMNTPGTMANNWQFRMKKHTITKERALDLYDLTCQSQRY